MQFRPSSLVPVWPNTKKHYPPARLICHQTRRVCVRANLPALPRVVGRARIEAPWAQEERGKTDSIVTGVQAVVSMLPGSLAFCLAVSAGGAPASAAEPAEDFDSTRTTQTHVSKPGPLLNSAADSPGAEVRDGHHFVDPLDSVYGVFLNHNDILNTNDQCSSKRGQILPDFSVPPLNTVVSNLNSRATTSAAQAAVGQFSTTFTSYKGHIQYSRCDNATSELMRITTGTKDSFCTAYKLVTGSNCTFKTREGRAEAG